MDLVDYDKDKFYKLKEEIENFLGTINIYPVCCIPISALFGENIVRKSKNMPWYKGPNFLESLDKLENMIPLWNQSLIFPVQDVYKIDGKRIIVGRIESGVVRKGDQVKILPSEEITKIVFVEKFPKEVEVAVAGESVGLITPDKVFIERGNIICNPKTPPLLTNNFYANVIWLSKEEFKQTEPLVIRCATQETKCKIEKIETRIDSATLRVTEEDAEILNNLEVAQVLIRTKTPIALKTLNEVPELGRFVLMRNKDLCGGGIIVSLENANS